MALTTQYLEEDELNEMFSDLSLDVLDEPKKQRVVSQAVGLLESALNKRFVVPLRTVGGVAYTSSPEFTRMKVEMAFRSAMSHVIAVKYMKGSDLNDLGTYAADQEKIFRGHCKDLLDYQNDFGLQLKPLAQDAQEPMQYVGIARSKNDMNQDFD